jgi:hypothetical protein
MANVTKTALSVTDALNAWAGAIAAFQPLLAAGMMVTADIVGFFKQMNPTATDAELNAILTILLKQVDDERGEIAKEKTAALADQAAGTKTTSLGLG